MELRGQGTVAGLPFTYGGGPFKLPSEGMPTRAPSFGSH